MQPRSLFTVRSFQNIFFRLATAFIFVGLATACDSEEPEEQKTLSVSKADISVSSVAGTTQFSITTNTSWSAVSDQSWCTLSVVGGSGDTQMDLTYTANEAFTPRVAFITIEGGDLTKVVKVTQEANVPSLTVLPATRDVSFASGSATFDVSANVPWTVTSNQTWLQVVGNGGTNNGTFTVNFTENSTGENRTAQLIVNGGAVSRFVVINQPLRPWMVSTLAGGLEGSADGMGTAAKFTSIGGMTTDASGNIYLVDVLKIRKVTASGEVSTIVDLTGQPGLGGLQGLAIDAFGNFYSADNARIYKITSGGTRTLLAGQTSQGYQDGNGANAKFGFITDLAIDAMGTLYIADWGNKRIRKVNPLGDVTTLAGGGTDSQDGTGASAGFQQIFGIDIDASNNIYVAGYNDCRVRKVTPAGVVTTVAGGTCGFADGSASESKFSDPVDVVVDGTGTVYVSAAANYRVRRIGSDGRVTTIAGSTNGNANGSGDTARFGNPGKMARDSNGNLFVTDVYRVIENNVVTETHRFVRKLSLQQ